MIIPLREGSGHLIEVVHPPLELDLAIYAIRMARAQNLKKIGPHSSNYLKIMEITILTVSFGNYIKFLIK